MLGALGDASWMIGMERNSDLVIMQAYSELLVNVNKGAGKWPNNLIGYDALNSYGSPSYYAQVLFNTYRGDEVLASSPGIAPRMCASVTRNSKTGTMFVKVVNGSGAPRKVKLEILGTSRIREEGRVIELSGKPEDTNSIQAPTKVAPTIHKLTGLSATFAHTFPAYSVTVLALYAN
jgi:alpha-L-arabinofuranosidase